MLDRLHKHTHTHTQSEYTYVILIALPLQLWFRYRASLLRYTYIGCLMSVYNAKIKMNRGNLQRSYYSYVPRWHTDDKFIRAYSLAISVSETLELFHSVAYMPGQCYNS